LVPFGYEDDRKAIPMRGRYKQIFRRNKLKLCILDTLRVAPADDGAIAARIVERKGYNVDDALRADVLEWLSDANQRAQKTGLVVKYFGLDGRSCRLREA
jgi:hypothetical protein